MKTTLTRLLLCTFTAAGLIACGGSSGGGGDDQAKRLSISLTDAPVDDATNVFVRFTGIELFPAEGSRIEFLFAEPRTIDLLAFQGVDSVEILNTGDVPAGTYTQLRLLVEAQSDTLDSFVRFEDGSEVSLTVPSGEQSGLKLQGEYTVREVGLSSFTIDFDLRKALTDPQGQPDIFLRPALRLVENDQVGVITGEVDPALLEAEGCSADPATGDGSAVYLYTGAGATVDDVGSADEPLASALVALNESNGLFEYTIGFVPEGEFTVAFTCQSGNDDPEADDAIVFSAPENVSVTAGATSTVDFSAPAEEEEQE